ncbi:hypothetical protein [Jeongeupia sp. USM3]|uniref:hypothetical protein n=1 Tax=Jeongeupia sp. USM3 TaxID=1906741 RepID=UPI00089DF5C4|nr:hypothetical protein [Jeongeupia sp. USM3]AOY01324.1 hypothetical protein BJP62_13205 [Jeongeupia sp. USM3]
MLSRLKTLFSTQLSEFAPRTRGASQLDAATVPMERPLGMRRAAYHDLLFRIDMAKLNGLALAIRLPVKQQPQQLRDIVADLDKLAHSRPDEARMLRLELFGSHDPHTPDPRSRFVSEARQASVRIHNRQRPS